MSREVRRVPVDWQHPVEPNPYWREQLSSRVRRSVPESRLHRPEMQFVSLLRDYPGAVEDWEQELANITERTGFDWTWGVEYHLTGCQGGADSEPVAHAFYVRLDGETEHAVTVRDEFHLQELLLTQKQQERPDPARYMPVFDIPEVDLGWCLYQTVSEGTPVTPVFATAEELIDHLATVGQDWDQQPMRRSAAEALVGNGYSLGTFVRTADGRLLDSSMDADLIGKVTL